jgi:flavin reductase (DIM6/NTAB) family NADH-FMN oxidoreductase RutF
MPVTNEQFRKVLGHFATGVTVVTTRLHPADEPWGFTVNAFTSVSLEPPLVLVCVGHNSQSSKAMEEAKHFAVNFLTAEQESVSRLFASRAADRFANLAHSKGPHGSPLLDGCLGFVECKKLATHHHGDHAIVIGEVLEAHFTHGEPLLYYGSGYRRLSPLPADPAPPSLKPGG